MDTSSGQLDKEQNQEAPQSLSGPDFHGKEVGCDDLLPVLGKELLPCCFPNALPYGPKTWLRSDLAADGKTPEVGQRKRCGPGDHSVERNPPVCKPVGLRLHVTYKVRFEGLEVATLHFLWEYLHI